MRYQTHVTTSVAGAMALNQAFDIPFSLGVLAGVAVGSLIPDIDEPQSLIGNKAKGIANATKSFFGHRGFTHSILGMLIFAGLMYLMTVPFYFIEEKIEDKTKEMIIYSAVMAAMWSYVIYILGDLLRKFGVRLGVKFFKKPLAIFAISFISILMMEEQFRMVLHEDILVGLIIGYVLHIMGDMFSKSGVPLFMPVMNKKIGIYLYITGDKRETAIKYVAIISMIVMLIFGDVFAELIEFK